jgi:vancomycin resistance protein VanJ
MSQSNRPGAPASFWRCERCATPNPMAKYLTHCLGCGAARPAFVPAQTEPPSAKPTGMSEGPTVLIVPRPARWLAVVSWVYAVLLLAILALIRWEGDRWWLATVLLFMPRWALLFPVVALMVLAGWLRRPALWGLHAATAIVVTGPVMGLSLPLHRLSATAPEGLRIKIMTLNQGTEGLDPKRLIQLLDREGVQVVCFQEGHTSEYRQPDPALDAYFAQGWYRNQKHTIASRFPIIEELPEWKGRDGDPTFWRARLDRVRIRTDRGDEFVLASVHLPSMVYAFKGLWRGNVAFFRKHIAWRWDQMEQVIATLSEPEGQPLLVGGDFNAPADSRMLDLLRWSGLRFGFEAAGWGYGYTRPPLCPWASIDHVLASAEWTFTHCWVGPDVGSDHLPLLAEVVLTRRAAPVRLRASAVASAGPDGYGSCVLSHGCLYPFSPPSGRRWP